MLTIELNQLFATECRDLPLGRRDDGVGVLAEKHLTEALIREKARSGALYFHLLQALASLALEFALRE